MPDSTYQQRSGDGQFDAIVIGAGIGGLYALHRLRDKLGMKVRVLEAGTTLTRDLNGTATTSAFTDAICREIEAAA